MQVKNKRAEITTRQIVLLIVLIISFAIILFFIVKLNLGEMTEKETCHNSVIARGSSVLPSQSIPLDCRRTYLCITQDGSCEQMTKPEIAKVENEEQVYGALAEEITDCWWMFGEGEVNYIGGELTPTFYCSICDQVAFDDSMAEIFESGAIDENEIYGYMQRNNVSGKDLTYLEYLYQTEDLVSIKQSLEEQGAEFGSMDITRQYYIMMGISSDVSKTKWASGAGGILGFVGLVMTKGSAIGAIVGTGVGAAAGYGIGFVVDSVWGGHYLSPSIIEVNSEEFKALECKSILTLS